MSPDTGMESTREVQLPVSLRKEVIKKSSEAPGPVEALQEMDELSTKKDLPATKMSEVPSQVEGVIRRIEKNPKENFDVLKSLEDDDLDVNIERAFEEMNKGSDLDIPIDIQSVEYEKGKKSIEVAPVKGLDKDFFYEGLQPEDLEDEDDTFDDVKPLDEKGFFSPEEQAALEADIEVDEDNTPIGLADTEEPVTNKDRPAVKKIENVTRPFNAVGLEQQSRESLEVQKVSFSEVPKLDIEKKSGEWTIVSMDKMGKPIENFTLHDETPIGVGGAAEVLLAGSSDDPEKKIAVKRFYEGTTFNSDGEAENLYRFRDIPGVPEIVGVGRDGNRDVMALEYVGNDLKKDNDVRWDEWESRPSSKEYVELKKSFSILKSDRDARDIELISVLHENNFQFYEGTSNLLPDNVGQEDTPTRIALKKAFLIDLAEFQELERTAKEQEEKLMELHDQKMLDRYAEFLEEGGEKENFFTNRLNELVKEGGPLSVLDTLHNDIDYGYVHMDVKIANMSMTHAIDFGSVKKIGSKIESGKNERGEIVFGYQFSAKHYDSAIRLLPIDETDSEVNAGFDAYVQYNTYEATNDLRAVADVLMDDYLENIGLEGGAPIVDGILSSGFADGTTGYIHDNYTHAMQQAYIDSLGDNIPESYKSFRKFAEPNIDVDEFFREVGRAVAEAGDDDLARTLAFKEVRKRILFANRPTNIRDIVDDFRQFFESMTPEKMLQDKKNVLAFKSNHKQIFSDLFYKNTQDRIAA